MHIDNPFKKFATADLTILAEIMREAESHLSAQLTTALSSNQRALSFTSLVAAATLIIGSASVSFLSDQSPRLALGLIAAGVCLGLSISMVLAIFASMPDKFWFVGNSPKMWIGDIESDLSYKASIAQQLEHYAYMIEENSRCMVICNKRLKCSMLIAWGTLLIGGCAVVIWIWQFR